MEYADQIRQDDIGLQDAFLIIRSGMGVAKDHVPVVEGFKLVVVDVF